MTAIAPQLATERAHSVLVAHARFAVAGVVVPWLADLSSLTLATAVIR